MLIWILFLIIVKTSFSQNFSPLISETALTTKGLMVSEMGLPSYFSFFNLSAPAMNRLQKRFIQIDYQQYILDTHYANISYLFPIEEYSITVGVSALNSTNFEHRLVDGKKIGVYSNSTLMAYTSASRRIYDSLEVALTLKWNYTNLHNYSAKYALIDFGMNYKIGKRLHLNVALKDLAFSTIKFRNISEEIENTSLINLAYKLKYSPIWILGGIKKLFRTNDLLFGIHLENHDYSIVVSFDNNLSKRLQRGETRNILSGFSIGGMVKFDHFQVALAFRELGILGNQLAFSLGKTFD